MLTFKKLGVSLAAMVRKQVFAGIFIILVILGVIYGIKKAKDSKVKPLEIPTSVETIELENKFNLNIPDDVEKINLQSEVGFEGVGIATRKYADGVFTHIIIADLPELKSGSYKARLVKDSETIIQTGVLQLAKGGYLLEFNSNINYSDYKKVEIISKEKVVLTGSF